MTKRATKTEGLFSRRTKTRSNVQDRTIGQVREIILRDTQNNINAPLLPLPERVAAIAKEIGSPERNVVDAIRSLEQKGEIAIEEREKYPTLATYCLSAHSNWFWASLIATVLSLWLVFATSGFALDLRYFFGTLLIVFLPGYSVVELIYARREENGKEQSEKEARVSSNLVKTLVFSVALSLIFVSMAALILNITPFGIRLVPLALILSSVTVVCLFGALARKYMQYRLRNYAIRSV